MLLAVTFTRDLDFAGMRQIDLSSEWRTSCQQQICWATCTFCRQTVSELRSSGQTLCSAKGADPNIYQSILFKANWTGHYPSTCFQWGMKNVSKRQFLTMGMNLPFIFQSQKAQITITQESSWVSSASEYKNVSGVFRRRRLWWFVHKNWETNEEKWTSKSQTLIQFASNHFYLFVLFLSLFQESWRTDPEVHAGHPRNPTFIFATFITWLHSGGIVVSLTHCSESLPSHSSSGPIQMSQHLKSTFLLSETSGRCRGKQWHFGILMNDSIWSPGDPNCPSWSQLYLCGCGTSWRVHMWNWIVWTTDTQAVWKWRLSDSGTKHEPQILEKRPTLFTRCINWHTCTAVSTLCFFLYSSL